MKKHSFYTLKMENRKPKAVLVDGYFDKYTNLFFYRSATGKYLGEWYAVCIHTGLSIAHGKTRADCYKEVQKCLSLYERTKGTEYFNKLVEQYNKAVQEALQTR